MEEKIFLKNFILDLDDIYNYLNVITSKAFNSKNIFLKKDIIGYTTFNYPIYSITIGQGERDIVLIGGTHGCEIISVFFMIELIFTLLKDNSIDSNIFQKYTFHIIPVLNPEGFLISSTIVKENFKTKSKDEIEEISKAYVRMYNQDDENAIKGIFQDKLYKKVLNSNINMIKDKNLKNAVIDILNDCNLEDDVLPIWSANGIGIDPNANSIHKFYKLQKYRINHKYGNLRYNDIPAYKPSPIGFYGFEPLDKKCPETLSIYKYVTNLYNNNLIKNSKSKLFAIFSYHLTGGEIYSTPEVTSSNYQKELHEICTKEYAKYTNYYSVNDKLKYGYMDYFRERLEGVLSITVELCKVSGNPISAFCNFNELEKDFINNKKALFSTINLLDNLQN